MSADEFPQGWVWSEGEGRPVYAGEREDVMPAPADARSVTDLETTALEGIPDFDDHISVDALDAAVAAVRELARQAAEAQTLRDALEQIRDTRLDSMETWREHVLNFQGIARAELATPDTPPGEYHAEGMDERGIYGGRAHDPAAPDTTQEPPRYEGGSLKRDAPWRES
jgi:hypothetical protein